MGAFGDAFGAYAQPLIEATDGSMEGMNRALMMAQLCWNLASVSEEGSEAAIAEMRTSLKMSAAEFEEFRRLVIIPVIQRHREMFPLMHQPDRGKPSTGTVTAHVRPSLAAPPEKYPGTSRNAPCPCGSGRKYKKCCGQPHGATN